MQAKRWKRVVVQAPAKLNLALAVTGVAENGYHTLDMVMQAVDVWETVEVVRSMGYSLRLPRSPIPANDNNTATKAAQAFFQHTGLLAGADITIHKKTPTRAGMAGGSADAAGVLVGLNALYGARLSLEELCQIGVCVGADVPFSLLGGTARVTGIGDVMQPLPPLQGCWFSIAMPSGGVSTPAAYQRFDRLGSPLTPDLEAVCKAIARQDFTALGREMQNMLEHANGDKRTARLRRIMDENGALGSMMTGSGAAVFGIFDNEKAARKATAAAKRHAVRVFCARPVISGPVIVQQS